MSSVPKKNYAKALDSLRQKLSGKGVHGMTSLKNAFNDFDLNNDGTLSFEEFASALESFKLSNQEIRSLFTVMDADQSNSVDYDEFTLAVRGKLSPSRVALIGRVFDLLDTDCMGVINCSDIGRLYNPASHPDVVSRKRAPAKVLQDFFDIFKSVGTNGSIAKDDFLDYYANTAGERAKRSDRALWKTRILR